MWLKKMVVLRGAGLSYLKPNQNRRLSDLDILSVDVAHRDSLSHSDIIIVVVGPAGSGKSTFIQKASGNEYGNDVAHTFQSSAREVVACRFTFKNSGTNLVLIDTPGFDSVSSSDLDVFESVVRWLSHSPVKLSGIVYMLPISNGHLARSSLVSAPVLEKLCGKDIARKMVLVSTMWEEGGEYRQQTKSEEELTWYFQDKMVQKESQYQRFMNTRQSAWSILDPLISPHFAQRAVQANTVRGQPLPARAKCQLRQMVTILMHMVKAIGREAERRKQNVTVKSRPGQSIFCHTLSTPLVNRPTSRFTRASCRPLLLEVATSNTGREAFCQLRGDDAQVMVDYLNQELREADIFESEEGQHLFSLFCKFAKSARVLPRSFRLSGVQYDLKERHREGGFATVHKGIHRGSGQVIAIKIIKKLNVEILTVHVRELTLWAHLSHPNILPFYGIFRRHDDETISLVSPWMENGNIREYSRDRSESERLSLLLGVAKGLCYLHERSIVHGDLKGANVLVSNDRRALIADFGISTVETTVDTPSVPVMATSVRWMAPERLGASVNTEGLGKSDVDAYFERPRKASDIWSFGCLVYEIMSQRLPYDQYLHDVRVISALLQQQLPGRRRDDHSEDSVAWLLMKYCWNFDPTQRPTCEDICKYFTCLLDTTERFLDIQAETSDNMPQVPAGLHLWEDMKRDGGKVNFSHIYHLLQEVLQVGRFSD